MSGSRLGWGPFKRGLGDRRRGSIYPGQVKGRVDELQWLSVILRTQQMIRPLDSGGDMAISVCRGHREGNRGPGRLVLPPHTAVSPSATWAVCTPSLETDFLWEKNKLGLVGISFSSSPTILVALQCPTPDVRVTQARPGSFCLGSKAGAVLPRVWGG